MKKARVKFIPKCSYCGNDAELVTSQVIYPNRPYYGMFWRCEPCKAYVGCHRNSKRYAPLGRLADIDLRTWKQAVHYWFDPLWIAKSRIDRISKSKARREGYKWLANELGIEMKECHVGKFDVETCKRAVEIAKGVYREKEFSR